MNKTQNINNNQDQYLKKNLLHFKPLSARVFNGIQVEHAALSSLAPKSGWQGKTVKALIKAYIAINYLVYTPIAMIEGIAFGIIGALGALLHCATDKRHQFLEKLTVKCLAHSFNSFAGLALAMHSLSRVTKENHLFPSSFHTAAMTDQFSYLGSAALAHFFGTYLFKGEGSPEQTSRPLHAFLEGAPKAIKHVLRQLEADNDYSVFLKFVELDDFYGELSNEEQSLLKNFSMHRIFDSSYLNKFYPIAMKYLQECVLDSSESLDSSDESIEEIENKPVYYTEEEREYQKHLMECTKGAVKMMKDQKLAKYLTPNGDPDEGYKLLEEFQGEVFLPLANLAQFIELNDDRNLCPKEFLDEDSVMKKYAKRRDLLDTARKQLKELSKEDQSLLIEHLIKTSGFKLGDRTFQKPKIADQLYNSMAKLARGFHNGPLLASVYVYNPNEKNGYSNESYFGDALKEAL